MAEFSVQGNPLVPPTNPKAKPAEIPAKEVGTVGSEFYLAQIPKEDRSLIKGVFIVDMIGNYRLSTETSEPEDLNIQTDVGLVEDSSTDRLYKGSVEYPKYLDLRARTSTLRQDTIEAIQESHNDIPLYSNPDSGDDGDDDVFQLAAIPYCACF